MTRRFICKLSSCCYSKPSVLFRNIHYSETNQYDGPNVWIAVGQKWDVHQRLADLPFQPDESTPSCKPHHTRRAREFIWRDSSIHNCREFQRFKLLYDAQLNSCKIKLIFWNFKFSKAFFWWSQPRPDRFKSILHSCPSLRSSIMGL